MIQKPDTSSSLRILSYYKPKTTKKNEVYIRVCCPIKLLYGLSVRAALTMCPQKYFVLLDYCLGWTVDRISLDFLEGQRVEIDVFNFLMTWMHLTFFASISTQKFLARHHAIFFIDHCHCQWVLVSLLSLSSETLASNNVKYMFL